MSTVASEDCKRLEAGPHLELERFWLSSHSESVIEHVSFSIIKNNSPADRDAVILVSICAWPAAISSSLAAFRSSNDF
eukprot:12341681-Heterocapsa_arctica.AAC.1